MKNLEKTIKKNPNSIIRVDTVIKGTGFTIQVGDTKFVTPKDMTKQITSVSGANFENLARYEKARLIMGTALALSY